MTTATMDVHGPIDFILMEFPGDRLTGEASQALVDLVESGTIRLYDLLVISKDESGSVAAMELTDSGVGGFGVLSGASSGLLGQEDLEAAAAAMREGTVAALIVYENSWAIPFVAAARGQGGEVIASARISAQELMDTLDALESAS